MYTFFALYSSSYPLSLPPSPSHQCQPPPKNLSVCPGTMLVYPWGDWGNTYDTWHSPFWSTECLTGRFGAGCSGGNGSGSSSSSSPVFLV
jgi:hypothetical protein